MIMLTVDKVVILLPFQSIMPFISFSCFIALVSTSSIMLNRSEIGHSGYVLKIELR